MPDKKGKTSMYDLFQNNGKVLEFLPTTEDFDELFDSAVYQTTCKESISKEMLDLKMFYNIFIGIGFIKWRR